MLKRNTPWIVFFLSIAFVILAVLQFLYQRSNASTIPDTPAAREIMATIERAYDILAIPFDTLELQRLDEVFIDDPIFRAKMTEEQIAETQNSITNMMGADANKNFGYLTAIKAKRLHQQHGAKLLKDTMASAAQSEQSISADKLAELTTQNYGQTPYLPNRNLPGRFPLTYLSMKIEGDIAYVRYDDGPALQDAILVRKNGRWFVAGLIPINVHF